MPTEEEEAVANGAVIEDAEIIEVLPEGRGRGRPEGSVDGDIAAEEAIPTPGVVEKGAEAEATEEGSGPEAARGGGNRSSTLFLIALTICWSSSSRRCFSNVVICPSNESNLFLTSSSTDTASRAVGRISKSLTSLKQRMTASGSVNSANPNLVGRSPSPFARFQLARVPHSPKMSRT